MTGTEATEKNTSFKELTAQALDNTVLNALTEMRRGARAHPQAPNLGGGGVCVWE